MNISFIESNIKKISIHFVGNKFSNEGIKLSDDNFILSTEIENILFKYFITPFNFEKLYSFCHHTNISFNEVYCYISKIFRNADNLYSQSINLAKHLYNKSIHPKIKAGEFYVVYFSNCVVDEQYVDAIGLFKSEHKDTFLKVSLDENSFYLECLKAINIKNLDKGCIIFNLESDQGYIAAIVENSNKSDYSKYWTKDFLSVTPRHDDFTSTQNMLSMCQGFISTLPDNRGKYLKSFYMNKVFDYLQKGYFYIDDFAYNVFKDQEIISKFEQYKKKYQIDHNIVFDNNFSTSITALKRAKRKIYTTIKLDDNFDINIHKGENFIKRGFDKKTGLFYYKLFFKEEK